MNNLLSVTIIVCICWGVLSQDSPAFTFKRQGIVFLDSSTTKVAPLVFKGKLSLQETALATPIVGVLKEADGSRLFQPLVPFSLGQEYSMVYNHQIFHLKVAIPEDYKHITVKSIYPTAKTLPSNILKVHIQFSGPINLVDVYRHIQFFDEGGTPMSQAILPLENVLVSEDETLLTLWIEPGRQKRGLSPNEALGVVFKEGKSYSMIVSKQLKDKNGVPLFKDFEHRFTIGKADRIQPDIRSWKIKVPAKNSSIHLVIDCDDQLDYVSVTNKILIIDPNERRVRGTWMVGGSDRRLIFEPESPWVGGNYQLFIDEKLDDLAGNNLMRLFDSEITKDRETAMQAKQRKLSFYIE
ncbi:Ig-like domain-containing protein [Sungkyunkwania multivorans]|uniref:Ig-like domain-containing protein n=1 Tax=Sungkyunkwania multivorans TaxID=1173618 RepID=A0ABW3CW98_9FLAO